MSGKFSFDTKCLDLAEYFLADQTEIGDITKHELANVIQTAIEDWLDDNECSASIKECDD